jgi:hypothetical protein
MNDGSVLMSTIHFQTVVGPEQVIRPPSGVSLPEGLIEVVVTAVQETQSRADPPMALRDWLLALAAESERLAPSLPPDLAERHDRNAHRKPLP